MAQCFVCAGDSSTEPLLTDLCDCRDLHLHSSCQRLIAQVKSHSSCCAICKSPYRNVRFETRWCGGDDDQDSHADRGASNLPPRPTRSPSALAPQAPAHAHASDLPLLTLCPFVCLFYGVGAAFGCDFCALFLPLSSLAYCCLWIHAFGPAWRKVAIVGGDVGRATRVRSARGGRASVARGMALRRSLKR